jgi:Na+/phosphate symporter
MVTSCTVQELISWKHSFSRLNEEYELAKKKKQALGNLLETGKISQTTHSLFTREIDEAVAEIDGQRKALLGKMASKAMELEEQIRTLEILLANFEIQHVADEVDDETYQRETELLSTGLETAKKELDDVQYAVTQLSNDEMNTQQDVEPPQIQSPEPEVKFSEESPQMPEKEQIEPVEAVVETIQCKEETQHSETEAKAEEKQQA